jgi:hypothetical protein
MYQSWSHISFLHWRYPADDIQRLLPCGLEVELFDSDAWLGVTPFLVEHFRLRLLPPIPWLSRFPETNVRTYVKGPNGEPGIWFFSLEASPRLAVIGGRSLYGLPYRRANMSVERDNKLPRTEASVPRHRDARLSTWLSGLAGAYSLANSKFS